MADRTRKTLHPSRERPDLDALLRQAREAFAALPPEAQEAMLREQRESWARGNVEIDRGPDARRTVAAEETAAAGREETHIIPVDDLREHVESAACWCRPRQDSECLDLFIHNSMDGREAFEMGERKPS